MVKTEQSRNLNQLIRTTSSAPTVSIPRPLPPPPPSIPMFSTVVSTPLLPQRQIDPNAIDITSLRGQFVWEQIPQSDTYMPVIFRGDTKYFCVRMLRKILPDYPEDVIRRSYQYQYLKTIDIYPVTACEVELLNRINSHHSRWAFSRQPFTALDEIVRVSDFIPFYEHLRHGMKSPSVLSNRTVHTLRQLLPHSQPPLPAPPSTQQTIQRLSDNGMNMPSILVRQPSIAQATSVQIQSRPPSNNHSRETISSTSRPAAPMSIVRQTKSIGNPYAVSLPPRLTTQLPPPQIQSLVSSVSNCASYSSSTVPLNNAQMSANMMPVSTLSSMGSSSSLSPSTLSSTNHSPPSSASPIPPQSAITIDQTSSIPLSTSSSSKSSRLHCGWLQVNKLYTPYISASASDHHLYKLPVSLLTFYDLLKVPAIDTNDSTNESLLPYEQTVATAQEIELINELCIKQNIKPFGVDTKLIQLSTFYQYCSANILFVKELTNEEPKISICKEWASIVQINGGICRLRNTTTLQEQTVPFIGNNLLKNFVLSSHCLSTASLTKPTTSELEFLQLILFFCNTSSNLRNAQLIDIESVKKEYNVDLILLFNDKFPLNVLNYQQQGNRPNTSPGSIIPTNSIAPTNTIAESTPPPSPPSPPTSSTNQSQSTNSTSQLPLTSSTNRYHKTIQFRGHSLTGYICSGLGSNTQRECVSIKSLCNILFPNSTSLDKLEIKMLRLLRLKKINRFRPQNQQSLGFTRLIDIKDAEQHWNYIEQEMHSMLTDSEEPNIPLVSNETSQASTAGERVVKDDEQSSLTTATSPAPPPSPPPPPPEPPIENNKGEKRPLDEPLDEEDIPVLERIHKRIRLIEKENHNQSLQTTIRNCKQSLSHDKTKSDDQIITGKSTKKRTIKVPRTKTNKKRLLPSARTNRQSKATWAKKYNIEDCCIQLNPYDPVYDAEKD